MTFSLVWLSSWLIPGPPAPNRLCIVSLDGASATYLKDAQRRGMLQGAFTRLRREGLYFSEHFPVCPSLTAVSHASIAAGAWPDATGIVSNSMFDPGTGRWVSGFEEPLQAEPVWKTALLYGRRVISIGYPFGLTDEELLRHSGFEVLGWGASLGPGALVDLSRSDFSPGPRPDENPTPFPPLTAAFEIPLPGDTPLKYFLTLMHHSGDARSGYDTMRVDDNPDPADGWLQESPLPPASPAQDWRQLEISLRNQRAVVWFKVLRFSAEPVSLRIYFNPPSFSRGSPEQFVREIEEKFGIWPGMVPHRYVERGLLDEQTEMEHTLRLSRYLFDVTLYLLDHHSWDLFLSYQALIDSAAHQYLLVDRRQPGYEPARVKRYQRLVLDAYRYAENRLSGILDRADQTGFTVCVLSDHGMHPVRWNLSLAPLLKAFRERENIPDDALVCGTSGTAVSLYVRPEKPGPEQVRRPVDILRRLQRFLDQARAGKHRLFEQVLPRAEFAGYHLDSPRSGDLIAFTYPEFAPRMGREDDPVLAASGLPLGQHGSDPRNHPSLRAICSFYGPSIARRKKAKISSVDLLPVFCHLLQIPPPLSCQGKIPAGIQSCLDFSPSRRGPAGQQQEPGRNEN